MDSFAVLPVIPENIPSELKHHPQWVVWKVVFRDGKSTKVPYNPATGRKARVNDPQSWTDFETALRSYQGGKYDGIGFVLDSKNSIIGIDIDKAVKPGEKLQLEKLDKTIVEIVTTMDTYTEISPSGTGLRLFAHGSLPKSGRKKGPFELYESGRFLTVTGHHIEGTPTDVVARPGELAEVHAKIFGEGSSERTVQINPAPEKKQSPKYIDDDDIMRRMLESASGGKISSLLGGSWTGYPSQSEADQALCVHLAFWFNRNPGAIDSVFRSSGLFRPKWDRKHHSDGRTYGQGTIDRAISQCGDTYTPVKNTNRDNNPAPEAAAKPDKVKKTDEQIIADYKKIGDPDKDQIREMKNAVVNLFNCDHAAVLNGGKFQIIREFYNAVTGKPDLSFVGRQDLRFRYENEILISGHDSKGKPVFSTSADIWLKSPRRREYDGITFDTRNPKGKLYNLYKPVVLKAGPGTCEPFLELNHDVTCNGISQDHEWLMDWLAYLFQNKGHDRPGTAIVQRGPQGCGKGTWGKTILELYGRHGIHIVHQQQITGRFVGHLKYGICVFVDEAVWAGDKRSEGLLKGLITEDIILIENKFIDPVEIRNHCNFIFASNNNHVIPAGLPERRFFVVSVSDRRVGDRAYWDKYHKQMGNGGVADLARLLMARKITHDLRFAPRTAEFLNQAIESMEPDMQFWFNLLQDGSFISPDDQGTSSPPTWPQLISRNGLYALYSRFCERCNVRNRLLSPAQLGRRMKDLAEITNGPRTPFTLGGDRQRSYRLPTLKAAREQFEAKIKYKISWDNDDECPF